MSAWLFDLGNTRLKCAALAPGGGVGEVFALPHGETDLAAALDAVLPAARIDVAHVASVADPSLRVALLTALAGRASRAWKSPTRSRSGWAWIGSWRCWLPITRCGRRCWCVA